MLILCFCKYSKLCFWPYFSNMEFSYALDVISMGNPSTPKWYGYFQLISVTVAMIIHSDLVEIWKVVKYFIRWGNIIGKMVKQKHGFVKLKFTLFWKKLGDSIPPPLPLES